MIYKHVLGTIVLYNAYTGYTYLSATNPDISVKKKIFYSSISGVCSILPFGLVNMFKDFYEYMFFSIYKML